jgi:small subunit ribosomal protein S16|tara:strand:+ start:47 stop:718 length:672 start_codon:yes stop_codon:yes gene_type:complete
MLRIRLRRQGARKQPTYRIVVADQREARDGRFVEIIGHYNPRTEPAVAHVDEARAYHWLGSGARPSDAVDRIFGWTGTLERFSRFKKGEELSQLLGEAEKAAAERPAPTKTRRDVPAAAARPKKAPEAALESETDTDAAAEVEAVAETEVKTEPAAEVDAEPEAKTDTEVESRVVAGPEAEAETEPASEAEDDPEAETKTEVEAKAGVEPAAKTEGEGGTESA